MDNFGQLMGLLSASNRLSRDLIDLHPRATWESQFVRLAMASSLSSNHDDAMDGAAHRGGRFGAGIEREVETLALELFGGKTAVAGMSCGTQASLAVHGLVLESGDRVVAPLGRSDSRAELARRFNGCELIDLPMTQAGAELDLDRTESLLRDHGPRAVVVAGDVCLFSLPLAELASLCKAAGAWLIYDMTGVAGLIAGGELQPSVTEYAQLVYCGSGGTLHCPEHGLAVARDGALEEPLRELSSALQASSAHPHGLAAMGVALSELQQHGSEYARQAVLNARALAEGLAEAGCAVRHMALGATRSHIIELEHPDPRLALLLLSRAGLRCAAGEAEEGVEQGAGVLRLGSQVVTRRGMAESEMAILAESLIDVLYRGRSPEMIHYDLVQNLAGHFTGVAFSSDASLDRRPDWYDTPLRELGQQEPLARIRQLAPFACCARSELLSLVSSVRFLHYERARLLFNAGDVSDGVYFVEEGGLQILDPKGLLVAELGPGQHAGELGVMSGEPRSYDVRVVPGTRLLFMDAERFIDALARLQHVRSYFDGHIHSLQHAARISTVGR